MLLNGISIGTIHDHILAPEPHERCYQVKHRHLLKLLPLFHKYDCPRLEADALELIISTAKTMIDLSWYAIDFLVKHYDPIAKIYGGTYPKKLYPAFAWSWKDERRRNNITPVRMTTIIETTPALALFLANSYCDALIKTEDLLFEARNLAEVQVQSLIEAQNRSKDMAEALKHIRHDPDG